MHFIPRPVACTPTSTASGSLGFLKQRQKLAGGHQSAGGHQQRISHADLQTISIPGVPSPSVLGFMKSSYNVFQLHCCQISQAFPCHISYWKRSNTSLAPRPRGRRESAFSSPTRPGSTANQILAVGTAWERG